MDNKTKYPKFRKIYFPQGLKEAAIKHLEINNFKFYSLWKNSDQELIEFMDDYLINTIIPKRKINNKRKMELIEKFKEFQQTKSVPNNKTKSMPNNK